MPRMNDLIQRLKPRLPMPPMAAASQTPVSKPACRGGTVKNISVITPSSTGIDHSARRVKVSFKTEWQFVHSYVLPIWRMVFAPQTGHAAGYFDSTPVCWLATRKSANRKAPKPRKTSRSTRPGDILWIYLSDHFKAHYLRFSGLVRHRC
jgi:hypothetical protein